MNEKDLQAYSDAWNDHDIDRIMSYHTADTVFETGGGTEAYGTRFSGTDSVRERFIEVWTDLPDIRFVNGSHFVSANRGVSEWTIMGTYKDGTIMELNGCDLFTFAEGKISVKNSLLKNRTT